MAGNSDSNTGARKRGGKWFRVDGHSEEGREEGRRKRMGPNRKREETQHKHQYNVTRINTTCMTNFHSKIINARNKPLNSDSSRNRLKTMFRYAERFLVRR